jgi:[protein-PII] uridylyltransferase
MGFAPSDVDILVGLVRNHLLLADAATRRDIRDPATVSQVAEAVRDPLSLELLHALTEADSKATGETAWTPWKAGLIADLVAQVERVLRGADPEPRPQVPEPQLQELAAQAGGELLVKAEGPELIVVAPDRPGLFCYVAGVLSLHGLDIVAADAWCASDGMAVDVFRVHRSLGGDPDWRGFHRDLAKVLDGALALEVRLSDRVRAYATHGARKTRRPPSVGVTVDNHASEDASVVEVRAPDGLSVLYRIAHAFVEMQLDIRHAKVLTMGEEVVDSFYVVDRQGAKLTDTDRIAELERAVLFELSRLTATG